MKPRNYYVKCPICCVDLIDQTEICETCMQWGKDNGINLIKRVKEEDKDK